MASTPIKQLNPEYKAEKPNYYQENTQAIINLRDHMENEVEAVAATNNIGATEIAKDVEAILNVMMSTAVIRCRGAEFEEFQLKQFLSYYAQYIQTILQGGILCPLTGREEEWEDITLGPDDPKKITVPFRGKEYTIEYKSVQVNKRYPNIYRFNKDNNYAHRVDMIRFVEKNNPRKVSAHADVSLRFIKFPYTLDNVNVVKDDISNIDEFEKAELQNRIVFQTNSGELMVAPMIPFHYLKKAGVDYTAELNSFSAE